MVLFPFSFDLVMTATFPGEIQISSQYSIYIFQVSSRQNKDAVKNPNYSGPDLMFCHCGAISYIRKCSSNILSAVLGSKECFRLEF